MPVSTIEDRARDDLRRVERRRKLLAEAEARLRVTARDYADAHGLRIIPCEGALRRDLAGAGLRAVA